MVDLDKQKEVILRLQEQVLLRFLQLVVEEEELVALMVDQVEEEVHLQ
tara:strand:+ start:108 stop:251 length:144 start_codon:yes stop_codon:yes gene_type:complete